MNDVRFWPKADIPSCTAHVPLSGVKQTLFRCALSIDTPRTHP
jgi:hypothetical protein